MKQLITEVIGRLGVQYGLTKLQDLQSAAHERLSKSRLAAAVPTRLQKVTAETREAPADPWQGNQVSLGSLASPAYVKRLNQRISRFKKRVEALERFKPEGTSRGK